LTKLVQSRWLDIGLVLFLPDYGPRRSRGPQAGKKELGQYPAILTEQAWSITHTSNIWDVMVNLLRRINKYTGICDLVKLFSCLFLWQLDVTLAFKINRVL